MSSVPPLPPPLPAGKVTHKTQLFQIFQRFQTMTVRDIMIQRQCVIRFRNFGDRDKQH